MKVEALKLEPLFMTVKADNTTKMNHAYENLLDVLRLRGAQLLDPHCAAAILGGRGSRVWAQNVAALS